MGVIQSQTIKGTFYTYIGVGIGLIINVILFPWFFTPEQVGLLGVILAYATIFAQFANLGFDSVTSRLFPYFRANDNKHNGYCFLILAVCSLGALLALFIYIVLKPYIIQGNEDGLLAKYHFYIPITALFILLFFAFDAYSRMLYKTVRGTFLKELAQRIFIIISIILFVLSLISFDLFVAFYFISIALPTLILIALLVNEKEISIKPQLSFISKDLRKSMFSVGFFGIITVFSSTVILNIDRIMIEKMIGLYDAGIYTVTFFFGMVILMPSRSLLRISTTVVAEAWKTNNIPAIKDVYYKSCINQLIFASLLFIGIWANIDNILMLIPEKYSAGMWVIFWICLGSTIDMATGINNSVIVTSRYYKFYSLLMLLFVLVIVSTNYLLIPIYGIVGAAIASAISTAFFNLVRFLFVWIKFKLQPFNYSNLLVIVIAGAVYFISVLIPPFRLFWIDIVVRSGIISALFVLPIYFLKISPDINSRIQTYINLIFHKNKS